MPSDKLEHACLQLSGAGFRSLYEAKISGNEALLGRILYLLNYNNSEDLYSLAPNRVKQFYDDLAKSLSAEEMLAAAEAHGSTAVGSTGSDEGPVLMQRRMG